MKYDFIQAYCLSKRGAEEDCKMFALVGHDNEKMLDGSYELIFNSLPKKVQNEITTQSI